MSPSINVVLDKDSNADVGLKRLAYIVNTKWNSPDDATMV